MSGAFGTVVWYEGRFLKRGYTDLTEGPRESVRSLVSCCLFKWSQIPYTVVAFAGSSVEVRLR